jgi:hypothetical protein
LGAFWKEEQGAIVKTDWKKRLPVLAFFLVAAFLASNFSNSKVQSEDVGASPLGGRYPYKAVVTLNQPDVHQHFEHAVPMTRSEYNDVRFSTKKFRTRVIKEARKALAKKLGYTQAVYGNQASQIENATVVDVELVEIRKENRSDGRISILREDSIL